MDVAAYWQMFLDTGAPEAYLLFRTTSKTEGAYVPDDSGHRPESHGVQ